MDKFGRKYLLEIQSTERMLLSIELPFTIEFDITRNTLSSANVCQVRIYNLSLEKRNFIRHNLADYGNYKAIRLQAGYGNKLSTIFQGNISQAWSMREGVNMITQIECFDGGFAFTNGRTNLTFPGGTPDREKIRAIASTLPHVKVGAIGNYETPTRAVNRANSYSGNPAEILTELTGSGFFVDNEKAHALKTDEYIANIGDLRVIDASAGLLNTPMLEFTTARIEMVFEPQLDIGQRIRLESATEAAFNGDYKVTAIKHRGMISETVCGSVITEGEFFYLKAPTPVLSQ